MCRWIAYTGEPIFLADLILNPKHSLVEQSVAATESVETTNGDGFGVGWYAEPEQPGLYRDVEPAWNDPNLADLARHIRSPTFLAHVRATSGTPIQRTNCHPFRHGDWLFVHNGLIRGYDRLRRDLAFEVQPSLYPCISGTTDSELMFMLALTFGLAEEPIPALERMAGLVESVAATHGVDQPLQMTLGLSDRQHLFAVRYSSEHKSRTLYHSRNVHALGRIGPDAEMFSPDARAIVSEPLNALTDHWTEIPESSALVVHGGEIETLPFTPRGLE